VKGMDYRAAGAAAYLGLGAVWAMGLVVIGGDADGDEKRDAGVVVQHQRADSADADAFLCRALPPTVILIVVSVAIAYLLDALRRRMPGPRNRTAFSTSRFARAWKCGASRGSAGVQPAADSVGCGAAVLVSGGCVPHFAAGGVGALDLNTYNLMFITVGLLLHWRPKRFMRAVADCVPATGGVLIQFPFYAVIFG